LFPANAVAYFKYLASFLVLTLLLVLNPLIARAQLIELAVLAFAGSAAVHTAGNEAQKAIDSARAAGYALLDRANDIGKQRLDQVNVIAQTAIDSLVGKSEEAAIAILDDATKKLNALRGDIVTDINNIIWNVECGARVYTIQDLNELLGGLGRLAGTNEIELTLPKLRGPSKPWYCPWCKDPNVVIVKIKEPFGATYVEVRDLMESAIADENIKEDTPAYYIVGTYEYLSTFARKTSCFYRNVSDEYNLYYIKYRDKAKQWRNVVDVKSVR
jgi:hypothetical protein